MKCPKYRTIFSFIALVGSASVNLMGCGLIVGVCPNVTELWHEVVENNGRGDLCVKRLSKHYVIPEASFKVRLLVAYC